MMAIICKSTQILNVALYNRIIPVIYPFYDFGLSPLPYLFLFMVSFILRQYEKNN